MAEAAPPLAVAVPLGPGVGVRICPRALQEPPRGTPPDAENLGFLGNYLPKVQTDYPQSAYIHENLGITSVLLTNCQDKLRIFDMF